MKRGSRCVAYSPESDTMAVGHNDGSLSIIDAHTLTSIVSFKDRKEEISDVKFSPGSFNECHVCVPFMTVWWLRSSDCKLYFKNLYRGSSSRNNLPNCVVGDPRRPSTGIFKTFFNNYFNNPENASLITRIRLSLCGYKILGCAMVMAVAFFCNECVLSIFTRVTRRDCLLDFQRKKSSYLIIRRFIVYSYSIKVLSISPS